MKWYLNVLKKYAVFKGRARRKEYWMFVLFNLIFMFIAALLDGFFGFAEGDSLFGPFYMLYILFIIIPALAVTIRRLHDVGITGWFILVTLVPFIGQIILLIVLVTNSSPGNNKYGPYPKEKPQPAVHAASEPDGSGEGGKENFSTEVSKTGKNFLTHTDKQVGYSIAFPESWKRMPEFSDYLVGFQAPDEELSAGVSCNVSHAKVPVEESLQSFFSQSRAEIEKEQGYNHVSAEELTINQMPAIKHIYHVRDKKTDVHLMQIFLKQGEVWWIITFGCTPKAFNSYLPVFESIASSFQLLGNSIGDSATFKHSKAAMKADIGGWGIPLIIMGVVQIFVPVLDNVWGVLLIAVGLLNLFVRQRFLFIVTGLVIIIAGIMNLSAVPIFAVLQFIWGGNEIRKYFKYESAEIKASDES